MLLEKITLLLYTGVSWNCWFPTFSWICRTIYQPFNLSWSVTLPILFGDYSKSLNQISNSTSNHLYSCLLCVWGNQGQQAVTTSQFPNILSIFTSVYPLVWVNPSTYASLIPIPPPSSASYSGSCAFTVLYFQMCPFFRLHTWSNLKSLTFGDLIWRLWSRKHILPHIENNMIENQIKSVITLIFKWK